MPYYDPTRARAPIDPEVLAQRDARALAQKRTIVYPPRTGHNRADEWVAMRKHAPEGAPVGRGPTRRAAIEDLEAQLAELEEGGWGQSNVYGSPEMDWFKHDDVTGATFVGPAAVQNRPGLTRLQDQARAVPPSADLVNPRNAVSSRVPRTTAEDDGDDSPSRYRDAPEDGSECWYKVGDLVQPRGSKSIGRVVSTDYVGDFWEIGVQFRNGRTRYYEMTELYGIVDEAAMTRRTRSAEAVVSGIPGEITALPEFQTWMRDMQDQYGSRGTVVVVPVDGAAEARIQAAGATTPDDSAVGTFLYPAGAVAEAAEPTLATVRAAVEEWKSDVLSMTPDAEFDATDDAALRALMDDAAAGDHASLTAYAGSGRTGRDVDSYFQLATLPNPHMFAILDYQDTGTEKLYWDSARPVAKEKTMTVKREAKPTKSAMVLTLGDYIQSEFGGAMADRLDTMLKINGLSGAQFDDVYSALQALSDGDLESMYDRAIENGMPDPDAEDEDAAAAPAGAGPGLDTSPPAAAVMVTGELPSPGAMPMERRRRRRAEGRGDSAAMEVLIRRAIPKLKQVPGARWKLGYYRSEYLNLNLVEEFSGAEINPGNVDAVAADLEIDAVTYRDAVADALHSAVEYLEDNLGIRAEVDNDSWSVVPIDLTDLTEGRRTARRESTATSPWSQLGQSVSRFDSADRAASFAAACRGTASPLVALTDGSTHVACFEEDAAILRKAGFRDVSAPAARTEGRARRPARRAARSAGRTEAGKKRDYWSDLADRMAAEEPKLRKVSDHEYRDKKAVVYKDPEWGEYRVQFYQDGQHLPDADYHTDDKADAQSTARHWVGQGKAEATDPAESRPESWPGLVDYDEDAGATVHPVVAAYDPAKVTSLKVVKEWEDDHLPCLAVRAVIDGTTYEWSDSCLSNSGVRMYYRAENLEPKALKALENHIKSWSEEGVRREAARVGESERRRRTEAEPKVTLRDKWGGQGEPKVEVLEDGHPVATFSTEEEARMWCDAEYGEGWDEELDEAGRTGESEHQQRADGPQFRDDWRPGDTAEWESGGLYLRANIAIDYDGEGDDPEGQYVGVVVRGFKTEDDREAYADNPDRNDPRIVETASLWNIDGSSDREYIEEVAQELADEIIGYYRVHVVGESELPDLTMFSPASIGSGKGSNPKRPASGGGGGKGSDPKHPANGGDGDDSDDKIPSDDRKIGRATIRQLTAIARERYGSGRIEISTWWDPQRPIPATDKSAFDPDTRELADHWPVTASDPIPVTGTVDFYVYSGRGDDSELENNLEVHFAGGEAVAYQWSDRPEVSLTPDKGKDGARTEANPNKTVAAARRRMGGFPPRPPRPPDAFMDWLAAQARAGRRYHSHDEARAAYDQEVGNKTEAKELSRLAGA